MSHHGEIALLLLTVLGSATALPTPATEELTLQNVFGEGYCENMEESKILCPDLPETCCCIRDNPWNTLQPNISADSRFSLYSSNATYEPDSKYLVLCTAVSHIPSIWMKPSELILRNTKIASLKSTSFNKTQLSQLTYFTITHDQQLEYIDARTFSGMQELQRIYVDSVEKLFYIADAAFSGLPKLRVLVIKRTGLVTVQGFNDIGEPSGMHMTITLSHNRWLSKIQTNAFYNVPKRVTTIKVAWNPILSIVENYAFNKSHVAILNFDDNPSLTTLSPLAFAGMHPVQELSFENTAVVSLPTANLHELKNLNAHGVPAMVRFPRSDQLPSLLKANLTYPYHCCALNVDKRYGFGEVFHVEQKETPQQIYDCDTGELISKENVWSSESKVLTEDVDHNATPAPVDYSEDTYYGGKVFDLTNDTTTLYGPFDYRSEYPAEGSGTSYPLENFHYSEDSNFDDNPVDVDGSSRWATDDKPVSFTTYTSNETFSTTVRLCYKDQDGKLKELIHQTTLKCSPGADLFSPCENLLGRQELVVVSWIVAWLAVLGNSFVIFMLVANTLDNARAQQRHLSVPKFLILNLAIGDFCMGVYVFALSVMDGMSNEQYYNYGVEWQTGGGCDGIGFLSIFASQLSIYTLSVISLERWYAIRYAIQLDKRLTLKCGGIAMLVGWCICILLAVLPLVGVNSYQKTAICLPMDVEHTSGRVYVALLLCLDIIAFVVVVGSYVWMYMIVRTGGCKRVKLPEVFRLQQKNGNDNKSSCKRGNGGYGVNDNRTIDARVAKRMAVLVFTDFACFFPICFFSLFALAGLPLVSMSTAKIVLIACYPFNACCNPFIYTILTKSFRKDVRAFVKSLKRCCCKGDDRHKITSKMLEKRSEVGCRQEERRKTIQVYVDGDAESHRGDFMSIGPRSNSYSARTTFVKSKGGSYTSGHFSNSRNNSRNNSLQRNALKSIGKWNNRNAKRKSWSTAKSNSSISSPASSEGSLSKRMPWIAWLARFGISIFKRRNGSVTKVNEQDSNHNSFETQTAATGVTMLCDKTENEPSETDPVVSKDMKSGANEEETLD